MTAIYKQRRMRVFDTACAEAEKNCYGNEAYSVTCDESNNPPSLVAKGIVTATIRLRCRMLVIREAPPWWERLLRWLRLWPKERFER